MDVRFIRTEFDKLAERLGIEVRYTSGGPNGLCVLKGRRVLFIDRGLDRERQVDVFIREFRQLDIEDIYVVPVLRRLLHLDDEGEDREW